MKKVSSVLVWVIFDVSLSLLHPVSLRPQMSISVHNFPSCHKFYELELTVTDSLSSKQSRPRQLTSSALPQRFGGHTFTAVFPAYPQCLSLP